MVNIVSLHNLKEDAKPIVGERVMFLSKIARSVNIPLGFVVTSNVYKAFIESNDLYKKIDSLLKVIEINDLDMLQHIANEIQKLIISTHLPKAIADEIIESYESLNIDAGSKVNLDHMVVHSDEPSVYINPSPLTETAYGAHHGFPNIKGKNKVLDIIVTCYASNFTAKAIENRLLNNIEDKGLSVVIQQMHYPAVSGMVSLGYINDDKHLIITACYGIMNDDVLEMADEYILSNKTLSIVKKDKMIQPFEFRKDLDSDELIRQDISKERAERQKLPDDEIIKLADAIKRLFVSSDKQMVLDYCIERGKLYILSADEMPKQEDLEQDDLEQKSLESEEDLLEEQKIDIKSSMQSYLGEDHLKKISEKKDKKENIPLIIKEEQERLIIEDELAAEKSNDSEEQEFVIDIREESSESVSEDILPLDDQTDVTQNDETDQLDVKDDYLTSDMIDNSDSLVDGNAEKTVKIDLTTNKSSIKVKNEPIKDIKEDEAKIGEDKTEKDKKPIGEEIKRSLFSLFKRKKEEPEKIAASQSATAYKEIKDRFDKGSKGGFENGSEDEPIEEVLEIYDSEQKVSSEPFEEKQADSASIINKVISRSGPLPIIYSTSDVSKVISIPETKEDTLLGGDLPEKDNTDTDDLSGNHYEIQEDPSIINAKQMLGNVIIACDLSVSAKIKAAYRAKIGNEEGLYLDEILDELKKKASIPYEVEIRKIRAIRNRFVEKGISPSLDEVKFALETAENFVNEFRG